MINEANTIEDLLELLTGLKSGPKLEMDKNDATIMYSIARQVYKGTALTDRQLELVKQKLESYKDQFVLHKYNFDLAVDTLRMPLRHIDRSKYIKIVSHQEMTGPDQVYESYKQDWKWIEVRFPFSKKHIIKIENLTRKISSNDYLHKKGSHQHFFLFNEKNVFAVLSELKDSNFEVSEELENYYSCLLKIKENFQEYLPGIYNLKLKNLNERAIDYMISSIGEVNANNISRYYDRKELFGLHHFDEQDLQSGLNNLSTLAQKIAKRKTLQVFVNNTKYNINNLVQAINELDRFPLLVMIPEKDHLSHLTLVHKAFNGLVDDNSSSVLFRLDNSDNEGIHFNEYIRQHKLNSPLDINTKIVYTTNSKIPKPLVKMDWKPMAVLLLDSSRPTTNTSKYVDSCDLIIHFDKDMSQFMRFQKQGIQEL